MWGVKGSVLMWLLEKSEIWKVGSGGLSYFLKSDRNLKITCSFAVVFFIKVGLGEGLKKAKFL